MSRTDEPSKVAGFDFGTQPLLENEDLGNRRVSTEPPPSQKAFGAKEDEDEDEGEDEFLDLAQCSQLSESALIHTCRMYDISTKGTHAELVDRLVAFEEHMKDAKAIVETKLEQANLSYADLALTIEDAKKKGLTDNRLRKANRKLKELKASSQAPPPKQVKGKHKFEFEEIHMKKKYDILDTWATKSKGEEDAKRVIGEMATEGARYATEKDGCRVLQKAIEVADNADKRRIAESLKNHITELVQDKHGNYVVQKIIEECAPQELKFIHDELYEHADELFKHPFGCRIFCRLFEHHNIATATDGTLMKMINDVFLQNVRDLIIHKFASYPMRALVEFGKPDHHSRIAQALQGRFIQYAKHEFASFVVEKILEHSDKSTLEPLVNEIKQDEKQNLIELHGNQRGRHIFNKLKSSKLISEHIHIPRNQARQKRAQEERNQAAGPDPSASLQSPIWDQYDCSSNWGSPQPFMGMPPPPPHPPYSPYWGAPQLDPYTVQFMMNLQLQQNMASHPMAWTGQPQLDHRNQTNTGKQ